MNKLQEETIAHYDRMIGWAKTRPQYNEEPSVDIMYRYIGEHWYSQNCLYCQTYNNDEDNYCPLVVWNIEGVFIDCDHRANCCNGLWYKMGKSKTWKTWIKYAEKVKQYIKDNG